MPRLLEGIARALDAGIRLIQLRAPSLPPADYRALAERVLALCAGRAQLMLKGPLEWVEDFPGAGWHLTAEQLRRAGSGRPVQAQRWLAAILSWGRRAGTGSGIGGRFRHLVARAEHGDSSRAPTLGWQRAADLLSGFDRPVFLLGGLQVGDMGRARQIGAQGIAAIRAFWPD